MLIILVLVAVILYCLQRRKGRVEDPEAALAGQVSCDWWRLVT